MPTQPTNASNVILRDDVRGNRSDVSLGPTRYTRSAPPASDPVDPTTYVASGYWRGSYAGAPWDGVATAGTSATTGDLVTDGSDPTTGTAVNGYTPAVFTAASSQLLVNATDITSLISTTEGTVVGLIYVESTIAATGIIYTDTTIFGNVLGDFGVSITNDGLGLFAYDGAYQLVTAPCSTGAWHMFRARFNGSSLRVTIDNGTEVSVACSTLTSLSGSIHVGSAYAGASFFDGQILELMTLPYSMIRAEYEALGQSWQDQYGLSLGFPALSSPAPIVTDVALQPDGSGHSDVILYAGLEDPPPAAVGYTLPCTVATFAVSGSATGLTAQRRLTADVQTYAIAGIATGLNRGRTMPATVATYALSGSTTELLRGRRLAADAQAYVISGSTTSLLRGRRLTADVQTYALSGSTTGILPGRRLTADVQAYSLAGSTTGLLRGLRLTSEVRTYAIAGIDVTLTYDSVGSYTLPCTVATFAVSGSATGLTAQRRLTADVQAYSLAGSTTGILPGRRLTADVQTYVLSGSTTGMLRGRRLTADVQTYALAGIDVGLVYTPASGAYSMPAVVATFAVSGSATGLTAQRRLTADVHAYAIAGIDVDLRFALASKDGSGTVIYLARKNVPRSANVTAQLIPVFVMTMTGTVRIEGPKIPASVAAARKAWQRERRR